MARASARFILISHYLASSLEKPHTLDNSTSPIHLTLRARPISLSSRHTKPVQELLRDVRNERLQTYPSDSQRFKRHQLSNVYISRRTRGRPGCNGCDSFICLNVYQQRR